MGFYLGGGIDQIDRKVCCLWVENGGMGMINIQEFIDSKRIKLLYRILHEPLESWNAIGKYWLLKLDIKFNEKYFVCKCSELQNILVFRMESMSLLHNWISSCNFDHDWIHIL
jgi:hypothetical protein